MTNIVIAGVGGQGSLLASKILGDLFMSRGVDVKVNEIHGMSQRGGSVVTTVRAGEKVYSPLIAAGEADILIGLEITEAARSLPLLKNNGKLFASSRRISVSANGSAPPVGIIGADPIDAPALAAEAGNVRCENVVMLGAASSALDFTADEWEDALRGAVKPLHIDVNLKAFTLGRQIMGKR